MKNQYAHLSGILKITKNTFSAWLKADPFGQSALVAYYAIFSIPPLLVIVISLAGFVFGKDAVQGEISEQLSSIVGSDAAKQIEDIVANSYQRKASVLAAIIGILTLILGSIGVFTQLQTSLNLIWGVKITVSKKWKKIVKDKVLSFGLVLSIGFLLLISLMLTSFLNALSAWMKEYLPDFMLFLFGLLDFVFSFGVITVLFGLMFKLLPDVKIHWRDTWIGALVTALLFVAGKFALGIYFAKADPASAYGAAGSIILVMLWVSYSCMIFFFGAEFTRQFANYHGRKLEPKGNAELIDETEKELKEHRAG